ncbi:hypothetical protein INT44_001552 [Umbelopsis vinacea]|uniref:Ion transport domain-containing protein n=1 Tax=Umbelopsis vinacea TaxID=44442 RepID=A0A8H7UCZ1_9FUNG|nr:hypothetical protein INT44_001552 [Umbelopsis vinacea]
MVSSVTTVVERSAVLHHRQSYTFKQVAHKETSHGSPFTSLFMPDLDDDRAALMLGVDDEEEHFLGQNLPTRTQHGLTRAEAIQGMANRFMYSRFYIMFYLGLAGLSLVSIILSLAETCPSLLFIILEGIINAAMILEVSIRMVALRRGYWKSIWNVIDTILVILCAITLIVIASGCSASERSEALFDTILLVIRNCVQFFRLFMMMRKNQHSLSTRSARIDFDDLRNQPRNASVEFSAMERGVSLEGGFLDDSDDDDEGRII